MKAPKTPNIVGIQPLCERLTSKRLFEPAPRQLDEQTYLDTTESEDA